MRYQPTDRPDRGFVGKNWSTYFLRSIQVILQATHGIVSGNPEFFYRAFGASAEEFCNLLATPQHFIFNREWYEIGDGKDEFEEYKVQMSSLSKSEKEELIEELSKTTQGQFHKIKFSNQRLNSILNFYLPLTDEEEEDIWNQKKDYRNNKSEEVIYIPDDEKVEDAGYSDMGFSLVQNTGNKIQPDTIV